MSEKAKKTTKDKKPEIMRGKPTEWADSAAIGKLIGKSARRVQQLTQEGILETEVTPGGGARKYKTCETVQRYIAHVEEKAKESGEGGKQAELALKKLEAEIALKESQGNLHKLKTAIAEGKYISADQASEELADFLQVFRRFTAAIPNRVAGSMAAYVDTVAARAMERELRKELESMLETFVSAAGIEEGEESRL